MARGRQLAPLMLSDTDRLELEAIANSRTMPHSLVMRAKIVLACAGGEQNKTVAASFGVSVMMVGKWRRRYLEKGIAGLHDEFRPGRPRTYDDEEIAKVINLVLQTKPEDGSTHWSTRTVAEETGISKSTVQRWLQTFSIQPHRQETFQISTDPFFIEKVRDIVGLYLNPPDNAVVLCVDEKSQIQALDRTQPVLPLGLGYVEGVTHNYIRHGTTTLFAALDIATGEVIAQCKPRHRHQEFLRFLRHIEKSVPGELDIHLIVDNYCAHKHAKVRAWLAQRPRFHIHFTPTYSSWLNQVERWFGIITERAIRRGSFRSVKELIAKIELFVSAHNKTKSPFIWTATADSIFEKLQRLCLRISGAAH